MSQKGIKGIRAHSRMHVNTLLRSLSSEALSTPTEAGDVGERSRLCSFVESSVVRRRCVHCFASSLHKRMDRKRRTGIGFHRYCTSIYKIVRVERALSSVTFSLCRISNQGATDVHYLTFGGDMM